MSDKASSEVSIISILDEHEVDKQAPNEEKSETLKREDKAILTRNGDLQYHDDVL